MCLKVVQLILNTKKTREDLVNLDRDHFHSLFQCVSSGMHFVPMHLYALCISQKGNVMYDTVLYMCTQREAHTSTDILYGSIYKVMLTLSATVNIAFDA